MNITTVQGLSIRNGTLIRYVYIYLGKHRIIRVQLYSSRKLTVEKCLSDFLKTYLTCTYETIFLVVNFEIILLMSIAIKATLCIGIYVRIQMVYEIRS